MKVFKFDQHEYTAKQRTHVNRHKLSIHEGMWYPCQKCNYQGKHIINVHNDLQNLKYCSYIVHNSDAVDQLMDQDHGRDSQHKLAGEGTAIKLCLEMFIY